MDPGAAVGPSRLRMDAPNLGDQPSILCRAGTLGPGTPGRGARGGHRQQATHQPHRHTANMRTKGLVPLPREPGALLFVGATGSPATSGVQRRNRFGVIPRSRAVCAVGWATGRHQFHGLLLEFPSTCSSCLPHVDHFLGEQAPPFSRSPLFRGRIIPMTRVRSSSYDSRFTSYVP